MSVYNQFLEQRQIQIKNTFDEKMRQIDRLKANAPTDPEASDQAKAMRHHLRLSAAKEYCGDRHNLEQWYGSYEDPHGDKNGK